MTALHTLEKQMAEIFKGAPKLSGSTKEALVKYWPYIALIGGLLQLFVAWTLFGFTRVFIEPMYDYSSSIFVAATERSLGPTGFDKTLIYLGIIMLLVDAVILLMAYPKLQQRSKKGWDLLFLAAILNAGYAVLSLFLYHGGITNFIGSLIGSVLGFYLLYQVRDKYSGGPRIAPAKKV